MLCRLQACHGTLAFPSLLVPRDGSPADAQPGSRDLSSSLPPCWPGSSKPSFLLTPTARHLKRSPREMKEGIFQQWSHLGSGSSSWG